MSERSPLTIAIQPWIDAYNAETAAGVTPEVIVFPTIAVGPDVARLILKALTGDQDA